MKKVCHFVEATGGGVLSVIADIVNTSQEMEAKNYKHTIIYSRRKETPAELGLLFPGIELIEISLGRNFISRADLVNLFFLAGTFRKFDVVHCHSSKAGFLGRICSFFVRGRTIFYYSPHCYAFLCEEFSRPKRLLIYLVEKILSLVAPSTTIACGDSEFDLSVQLGGRCILLRNGVSVPPRNFSKNIDDDKTLLAVGSGRNCLQKDPVFFENIVKQSTHLNISFKWIGDHPTPGLGTGWITREAAQNILGESDIFIATSRWEGLPIAGLEAMRDGKPLLVRNCPGFRDLVIHGFNGFIYETVEEAVAYLNIMCSSKALVAHMGEKSRYIALKYYSTKNYRDILGIYGGKKAEPSKIPGYSTISREFQEYKTCLSSRGNATASPKKLSEKTSANS